MLIAETPSAAKQKGPRILTFSQKMTAEQVGGKFQHQQIMARAGIAVPPFFCLTTNFYEEIVSLHRPRIREILGQAQLDVANEVGRAADLIRELFQTSGFSRDQEQTVISTYEDAFPDGSLVSVRASMVGFQAGESEDSSCNPFAGISDSFLFVNRSELIEKIILAMASGFSSEAIFYRHKQNMNATGFSVAVGVQRMVVASKSFVTFTCNPKSAAREVVIIAGYGAGEGVVQDKVPVDHFFLNPISNQIRSEIADKHAKLALAPEGRGLAETPIPPELRTLPSLGQDEIRAIAALALRIEKLFQAPQDIEGSVTEDGTIRILQARNIVMNYELQRVWTNSNVTESFPGVTTPLTYSLARYFYRVIFFDCYRLLGIGRRELHAQFELLDRMIGFLGGRIYYCLTSFYRLHSQSPLFPIFRAHWEKMMGFQSSYEIPSESFLNRTAARTRALVRLIKAVVVIAYRFFTHERDIRSFHAWWEDLITPRRGRSYETQDPLTVIAGFHNVWTQVGSRWGVTLMNDTYLPVLYGWVEGLFRKWKLDDVDLHGNLLSGLLCGDEQLVSVEIILSAVKLSEEVSSDPELARQFRDDSAEELWRKLESNKFATAFTAGVHEHLLRYGDRGFQELKIEQPSLRNTPWLLLRMIKAYAADGLTVDAFREKELQVRRRADNTLANLLKKKPARKFLLQLLLSKLRRLIRNRENSRYCRSELFSYSKSVFVALGESLVRNKVLTAVDDIYYLTQDEIFGYFDGTGVSEDLQTISGVRRSEARENGLKQTEEQITTLGSVRQNNLFSKPAALDSQDVLRGIGSSAGVVRGLAHVVLDPNQPVDLGTDGVLVARETDPGWLFLMLSSKGIVVERGSMLSHTAITGRKFGIPTVVSVAHATSRILEGSFIEVDGASGTVTILDAR